MYTKHLVHIKYVVQVTKWHKDVDGFVSKRVDKYDTVVEKFKVMYICSRIKICKWIEWHTSVVLKAHHYSAVHSLGNSDLEALKSCKTVWETWSKSYCDP